MRKKVRREQIDEKKGPRWLTGTVVSTPRRWWLLFGVRRGSGVGLCSPPLSCSGGPDRTDPHTDIPRHCAHTLAEVAGPLVCGGGTTANVGEATCAMGWPQCLGSGTKRGRTGEQMGTGGGMGAREGREGEKEE